MQKSLRTVFFAVLVAMCMTIAAQPAAAQRGASNVARVYYTEAKNGDASAYEQARVRHIGAHKSMGDAWTWFTWQIDTGDNAGAYYTVTFGHKWADFDAWEAKFAAADGADAEKNLNPVTSNGSNWFAYHLENVSTPSTGAMEPMPMAELIHFRVRPGMERDFMNNIRKIHEAIQKSKWPATYDWYAHGNGSRSGEFVLALGLKSYADMDEPEVPFPAMLEKAVGRTEAQNIMQSLDASIFGSRSELIRFRKDLSYIPAAK